jgi:hypothetical protein
MNTLWRRMMPIVLASLAALGVGCHAYSHWTRTELYFGTQCGAGCTPVSEADWERFVGEEIAPRFPQGFTVYPARGRWLTAAGAQNEQTYVLVVVYPARDPLAANKLQELRKFYRDSFRQQAVLEIDLPADASF